MVPLLGRLAHASAATLGSGGLFMCIATLKVVTTPMRLRIHNDGGLGLAKILS